MVHVAKLQLDAGAKGLTCAKIGEAEAMLPSGVREIFLAHSLADPSQAGRIVALKEKLADFRVALTSEAHLEALVPVARAVGGKLRVMLAVDTGLGREGVRDQGAAGRLAAKLSRHPNLELCGLYTHEGQLYALSGEALSVGVKAVIDRLAAVRDAIDPGLPLWPGSSPSAALMAELGGGRIQAVRPGTYVFGDISLTETTSVMAANATALAVVATVIDRPEPALALIDAGSKTFSSDRTAKGIFARAADGRSLEVFRVNEEHGYLRGNDLDSVRIGDRIAFTPAHVCTSVNLADRVLVVDSGRIADAWPIEARGKNT
jgi:D-serine deaminase-like pyridoxal phosphate-dependent protein